MINLPEKNSCLKINLTDGGLGKKNGVNDERKTCASGAGRIACPAVALRVLCT